jgi:hypothetical protein
MGTTIEGMFELCRFETAVIHGPVSGESLAAYQQRLGVLALALLPLMTPPHGLISPSGLASQLRLPGDTEESSTLRVAKLLEDAALVTGPVESSALRALAKLLQES